MSVGVLFPQERVDFGKVSASKLRNAGFVPILVYSTDLDSSSRCSHLSFTQKEAIALVSDPYSFTKYFKINVSGSSYNILLKEAQFHPVTGFPTHMDFAQVKDGESVVVSLPIRIINKHLCVGVKRGGDVHLIRYNAKVRTKISDKNQEIIIDVEGVGIGAKFDGSNVILPQGSTILENTLLAKVSGKRGAAVSASDGDAPAEGATTVAEAGKDKDVAKKADKK